LFSSFFLLNIHLCKSLIVVVVVVSFFILGEIFGDVFIEFMMISCVWGEAGAGGSFQLLYYSHANIRMQIVRKKDANA
jgi:hypothetical protein